MNSEARVLAEKESPGKIQLPVDLAASIATLTPAQLELLHAQLKKLSQQGPQRLGRITRRPRESNRFPLSFAQQRMWFMEQLTPGTATNNIPTAIRLTGRLEVAALGRSLNEIVRRHEALRTTFMQGDDRPVQMIAETGELKLKIIDLREMEETERQARAAFLVNHEAQQPFDLTTGPLLRATLLRMPEEHILLFTIHHIVSDKWSQDVLLRELVQLYDAFSRNVPSPLPELPFQY